MADTRPTFLPPQRYTLRKQKQFSRPMTGHTPQKLPFFNAISCIIAFAQGRLCLHALDNNTTETFICQLLFSKKFSYFHKNSRRFL